MVTSEQQRSVSNTMEKSLDESIARPFVAWSVVERGMDLVPFQVIPEGLSQTIPPAFEEFLPVPIIRSIHDQQRPRPTPSRTNSVGQDVS